MKLNLLWNGTTVLNGYLNIDPFSNSPDKQLGDLHNLDNFCADSEATEIIADNVLDFYTHEHLPRLLEHWTKKLRLNGTLTVTATEIYSLGKSLYLRAVSVDDINKKLFGSPSKHSDWKKSVTTLNDVVGIMQQLGLKILQKSIEDGRFVVQGQKV